MADFPSPRILIADDTPDVLVALRLLLKPEGFAISTAQSVAEILELLRTREFDAALVDLNYTRDTTSGAEGLDLLAQVAALDPVLPVVVMTAWGSIELAVEAMRRGARDFVQKPWDNVRLLSILRTQVELARAMRLNQKLREENDALARPEPADFIARSAAMRPVLDLIERIGPSDANVLITGEHGSGKEVVARALHAASPRSGRPMVAVNAGSIAETLFESELFGHVKGAFTGASADRAGRFEMADRGTLFLDEIANLPLAQQAKILRVLETGEFERLGSSRSRRVDVRLLSATNADPGAEVAAGRFREDLLFRINTVHIHLPPLRERGEDIQLLAMDFLRRYANRYRRPVCGFEDAAVRALLSHPWPGNVRELDHVVQRAVLLASGENIAVSELGFAAQTASAALAANARSLNLEQAEREVIRKALEHVQGNVAEAAKQLGLSRSSLYRRLQKYGML
jgi:DNA-binding NtrC family response regulator